MAGRCRHGDFPTCSAGKGADYYANARAARRLSCLGWKVRSTMVPVLLSSGAPLLHCLYREFRALCGRGFSGPHTCGMVLQKGLGLHVGGIHFYFENAALGAGFGHPAT
jgi:hypothetical protein